MPSAPLPGSGLPGAVARAARYLRRPELRRHPLRSVGRRCYLEGARRLAPGRLARLHTSPLQGTAFSMVAPLTEPVGRSLFLYGVYEPLATTVFASLLREGDVAVDVGAHYGDFTLVAASVVGPRGRVLAFEPQDAMRAVIGANLARNHLDNVEVLPHALSDYEGTARLFRSSDPLQTGGASLRAEHVGQSDDYVETTVRRLDDVMAGAGLAPAAMKLDVEGEEAAVLRGAEAVLERARPAVVLEVNGLEEGGPGVTCPALDVLRDLGYSVYGMVGEAAGFHLEPLAPGQDPRPYREPWLALNVVAVAPDSEAERRLRSAEALR